MKIMENSTDCIMSRRKGLLAISPIAVFLILYLVVSLIIGDFYKMPISVALLIASAWAVIILRGKPLARRVEIFSRDAGSSNVMYMVWIFILAGAFAALAKETGAIEATVNLALRWLPAEMLIPGLFLAACFISLSIGTSVGTVVALTPLAVELAQTENGTVPFFVAVVLGGAFFGDNLSFISDTTIAATRTQGCKMNDKFKANLYIVLPAALCALGLYIMLGADVPESVVSDVENPWLVLPYLVIIIMAVAGVNVTVVLAVGIVTALLLALGSGFRLLDMFGYMGEGIDSVGNLVIITLLAAGMLGKRKLLDKPLPLCVFGAAAGIAYSFIMDVWTVLSANGSFTGELWIAAIISALPVTGIYCVSNVIFLLILNKPLGSKLERLKTKYGVFLSNCGE